ncbi:unnamed protein product [Ilex paraguariensis]|uniref:PARP1-like PADR1 domain-containing protein n=1 Tax=Ilex paraguariensis TaxID=185542 RepID=A0ABC8UBE9_9AQUA
MHYILQANGQDPLRSYDAVVAICQDLLFYGPLDTCTVCGRTLEFTGIKYWCKGTLSEWITCIYSTRDPPRKQEPIKLPDSIKKSREWRSIIEKHGGKVVNSAVGATCLVVSPAERERGGSVKIVQAMLVLFTENS